jgi:hypothetical protein
MRVCDFQTHPVTKMYLARVTSWFDGLISRVQFSHSTKNNKLMTNILILVLKIKMCHAVLLRRTHYCLSHLENEGTIITEQ